MVTYVVVRPELEGCLGMARTPHWDAVNEETAALARRYAGEPDLLQQAILRTFHNKIEGKLELSRHPELVSALIHDDYKIEFPP